MKLVFLTIIAMTIYNVASVSIHVYKLATSNDTTNENFNLLKVGFHALAGAACFASMLIVFSNLAL